jgi:hypothetical protein
MWLQASRSTLKSSVGARAPAGGTVGKGAGLAGRIAENAIKIFARSTLQKFCWSEVDVLVTRHTCIFHLVRAAFGTNPVHGFVVAHRTLFIPAPELLFTFFMVMLLTFFLCSKTLADDVFWLFAVKPIVSPSMWTVQLAISEDTFVAFRAQRVAK